MLKRAGIGFCLAGIAACAVNVPADREETIGTVEQRVLTPSLTTYAFGASVQISFDGLPGPTGDWIAIAKPSMPSDAFTAWKWSNGASSGSMTFDGLQPGTYVARAYYNWPTGSYTIQQTSVEFTIGPSAGTPTVTPPASTAGNAGFSVAYAGMPGNPSDWIAVAPAGSPNTVFTKWAYTRGGASGSVALPGVPAGSYVARAFRCWECTGTYDLVAETPFTVTAGTTTLTPPASVVASTDFAVGFAGMAGHASDWVAIAPAGSAATVVTQSKYTGGGASGSLTFTGLASGQYVARAYYNWAGTQSYTTQAERPFAVVPSGTLAYWQLDETANPAMDVVGNRTATAVGTVTFGQTGVTKTGTSASFNGSSRLSVPYDAALNPAGTVSVECWIAVSGGSNFRSPVTSRSTVGGLLQGYILYVAPDNTIQFWTGGNAGAWSTVAGPALALNTLYHVVGTFTGGQLRVYLNGALAGQAGGGYAAASGVPFFIGQGVTEGAPQFGFTGRVDEVAIYNRALSDAEILARYNNRKR